MTTHAPFSLARSSTAAPAVSAFRADAPSQSIRFRVHSCLTRTPRISAAIPAFPEPESFGASSVPETMAMYLVDDLELLDDDFEFDGFGDTAGHAPRSNKHKYDTTSAAEYRNGKDMQGIPWERLDYSRDNYRGMRLKEYRNYESLSRSHELLDSECKQVERKGAFYDFCFNTRLAKSTVVHFQDSTATLSFHQGL